MRVRLLAVLSLVVSASLLRAEPVYLALGDSSAFGETNRTKNPSDGDRGYVKPFADYLGTPDGTRPTVANFAIDGETSASFFAGSGRVSSDGQGHNPNYNGLANPYAQSQRLQDSFNTPAANADVKAVTVQLGANNLDAVASSPGFLGKTPAEQQSMVAAALGAFQADYAAILGDVRTRFPTADVYALGYHNPYNGDPTHPFYPLADPAVQGLNQVIAGVASAFGAKYVDVYGAIHPNEAGFTLIATWQKDPVNYVHLNDAGYAAVAGQLIRTAGGPSQVPEPATLILAGVGGMVLLARRTRREKIAAAA